MISEDKYQHFIAGMIVAAGGAWLFGPYARVGAMIMATGFGAAKEIYDYFHPTKHTCDPLDFLATVAGGLWVAIILSI